MSVTTIPDSACTPSKRGALLGFYVGPLVLWMVLIFFASTEAGTTENSGRMIRWLLTVISPDQARNLSPHTLHVINIMVRKLGHVTEYAILTLLAVRAIQFGAPSLKKRSLLGAFLISLLYACSDEIHQRFVPGRGASPIDVAIDMTGVVLVMAGIVVWFWVKSIERRLLGGVRTPPEVARARTAEC
ncbi:MAG: VanZ family protein [Chloroherpetonaceae bacterium]|nr:VanZ family protein [Chthonomonadaceae bacterium]MDW8208309.1 VanZ family protein [Chloroherpetonaceae bacterium]